MSPSRNLTLAALCVLSALSACIGADGASVGGGSGALTRVPLGGCETDPFAGTCVDEFKHADGCWDPAGECRGTLADLYWDNGASVHSTVSPGFQFVDFEFFGSVDLCFTAYAPIDTDTSSTSFAGTYTRVSDGAEMTWHHSGGSIIYTCPDGRRVQALLEQRECVYGETSSQCDIQGVDEFINSAGSWTP